MDPVFVYDTTLRDGTQGENISFSAGEKLSIARRLDDIGVHYIEGGWPGSNPRDMHFFQLAQKAHFSTARIAAFGATRKPGISPADDKNIQALLESGTAIVTIFGKTWDLHVETVMDNTLEENLAMIGDSVEYLGSKGREVIYDAEHFFDGYKANPDYALETLCAAVDGGAAFIVLCDTNGGTLTHEVDAIFERVKGRLVEKYCRNDAPLPFQPQARPIIHSSRYVNRDLALFLSPAASPTAVTRLLDDLSFAFTFRASTDVNETPQKALLPVLHLSASLAGWTRPL